MNIHVLIVEDDIIQAATDEAILRRLLDSDRRIHGISGIQCTKVRSASAAIAALDDARKRGCLFDFMILDMSLPERDDDDREVRELGLKVLKHASETGSVRTTIVISVHADFELAYAVFKGGGVDYVRKNEPNEFENLQVRVLSGWNMILMRESDRIERERITQLVPYADQGLASRLGTCFSGVVQAIRREVRTLRQGISERFHPREGDDALLRPLDVLEKTSEEARTEWKQYEAELELSTATQKSVDLCELLQSIEKKTAFAFTAKRVELVLPRCDAKVLSFGNDVPLMVEELLLGGVAALDIRADGQVHEIGITAETRPAEGIVTIGLRDTLPPLSTRAADVINRGGCIRPEGRFGRDWGLSVVQHIALRGGGKLVVHPGDAGNTIKLHLPAS